MTQEIPVAAVYFMAVAMRLTGLTARQIRYWEQQGLITPARTGGGHRLYSEADLVRLKQIKRLLTNGSTMEQVKAQLASRRAQSAPAAEASPTRFADRIPTDLAGSGRSLYSGANRAELQRLIDRKPPT